MTHTAVSRPRRYLVLGCSWVTDNQTEFARPPGLPVENRLKPTAANLQNANI